MSSRLGDFFRPIADAFTVPMDLVLILVAAVAVTRIGSSAWHRARQRGRRPLVIRVSADRGNSSEGDRASAMDDRLLAYLAADSRGDFVIAPGAGGTAAPGVTTEALEPGDGWAAALLRQAIAQPPSYLVDVTWPQHREAGTERTAVVRISRTPGGSIVASDSFTEHSNDDLIEAVGCFCITFLRRQPRILRRTPRWERWSQDINGYRAYRAGLEHLRHGTTRTSSEQYELALQRFGEAARIEPANLLVQLHRAALLELNQKFEEAVKIYSKCYVLWPEHIETGYRLSNARKNAPGQVSHGELCTHLDELRHKLRRLNLLSCWIRTFRPSRWNPGERRYWRSWLRPHLPGIASKRATYLHAITISTLLAGLSCLIDPRAGCECGTTSDQLMTLLAKEILCKPREPAPIRLLYPGGHQPGTQNEQYPHLGSSDDSSRIPAYRRGQHRSNVGWLALFNAACFFSLAIRLKERSQIPSSCPNATWEDDCARAAIRELGLLVRHPQHALEADWIARDPDLDPMRRSKRGKDWENFVGLPVPVRPTAISPSGTRRGGGRRHVQR